MSLPTLRPPLLPALRPHPLPRRNHLISRDLSFLISRSPSSPLLSSLDLFPSLSLGSTHTRLSSFEIISFLILQFYSYSPHTSLNHLPLLPHILLLLILASYLLRPPSHSYSYARLTTSVFPPHSYSPLACLVPHLSLS